MSGPISDTPRVPVDPRRCVVIPSYNNGPRFAQTVREVLAVWRPVIVICDGSTDGSEAEVVRLGASDPNLHVLVHPRNSGKGVAAFAAFNYAIDHGYTHAAVFDADGQHDAEDLPRLMEASCENPNALIMGVPEFPADAPGQVVRTHRLSDFFARVETLCDDFTASLFGLRVYPLYGTLKVMQEMTSGYRSDFDLQLAVRLSWQHVPFVRLPAKIRFPEEAKGNISRAHRSRDRFVLFFAHWGLLLRSIVRWPTMILQRFQRPRPFDSNLYPS